jgi:hypothetical protein
MFESLSIPTVLFGRIYRASCGDICLIHSRASWLAVVGDAIGRPQRIFPLGTTMITSQPTQSNRTGSIDWIAQAANAGFAERPLKRRST